MKNEIRELSVEEVAEVSGGDPRPYINALIAEGEASSEISFLMQMYPQYFGNGYYA
ncbi:hypothetical protein ACMZOO_06475 [Catenovulum sp. SX2]|uniref:hypothetical protein n=1 Tax=Catenovulum sp. SX2 TaxID=3398614 RepID=UPI003F865401